MATKGPIILGIGAALAAAGLLLRKKPSAKVAPPEEEIPEEEAPEVPMVTTPAGMVVTPSASEAQVEQVYEQAGYSGKQLTDIVNAVITYNQEIERIENQTPAATQQEIVTGGTAATTQANEAYSNVLAQPESYAPFTEAQIEGYKSVPVTDIYGNAATTKADALECANRQLRIAEMQTDPAIRASMLLIAQGMFEQAYALP